MDQTKPSICRDAPHSLLDRTGIRALNAMIDAVSAAEAGGGFDSYQSKARDLLGVVNEMSRRASAHGFSKDDMQALLTGLLDEGKASELFDYASAEQATMALGAIISAMKVSGAIDTAQLEKMNAALERCYAATADDELYRPSDFAAAIEGFRGLIR